MNSLRMWSREDSSSIANLAVNQGSPPLAAVDAEVIDVAREHLDPSRSHPGGIDEDSPAVIVGSHLVRRANARTKGLPGDRQPRRPRADLAVVGEALERASSTRAGEEGQLPTA